MKYFLVPLFALALGQAAFAQESSPSPSATVAAPEVTTSSEAPAPSPTSEKKETPAMNDTKTEKITLGGGCFWCMEALYQAVDGVTKVTSGFAGGKTPDPSYEQVCTGTTGHAEVVQLEFDPAKVSLDKILTLYWKAHDPTTLNQQGADHGTQYRSIILYSNDTQKAAAEKSKVDAQKNFRKPIVTEIVPLTAFYPAETYHQNYYKNNPREGYSEYVIEPKLEKFKKELK